MARNLAILLGGHLKDKEETRALIKAYPHFLRDPEAGKAFRQFIK